MPLDFISVARTDSNATHATELLKLVSQLRDARTQAEKVLELGKQMQDSEDYSLFAARFGVPLDKAKTVYQLVNGTVKALNGALMSDDAIKLISKVG